MTREATGSTVATSSHPAPATPDFHQLCVTHFQYVWSSLQRLGVRPPDAEDLAHDVLLTVHQRLHTYDPTRPLEPWLFGIVYNLVRAHRRQVQRQQTNAPVPADIVDAGPLPSSEIERADARELVLRALSSLPDERRAVFVLHDIDRAPMREVTEALGIPLQTGYSRLRKARNEFREAVTRLGGDDV